MVGSGRTTVELACGLHGPANDEMLPASVVAGHDVAPD
jgi:hypothetical protein